MAKKKDSQYIIDDSEIKLRPDLSRPKPQKSAAKKSGAKKPKK